MRNSDQPNIFDLLKKENFVQWVLSPCEESNHYWSKWIASHPDRKRDVEYARQIILSSRLKSHVRLSEEKYDQMLNEIVDHSVLKNVSKSRTLLPWKMISIASSILLLLVCALYVMVNRGAESDPYTPKMIVKETMPGSKITTRLPDGSLVTLNSGSELSFPEKFQDDSREVLLNGEAFFEVKADENRPFIVRFSEESVRVLGTKFNIRSYEGEGKNRVSVASGKVAYTIPSGEQVVLNGDEMATYTKENYLLTTGKVDELQAFGWKDRIIYFQSAPFSRIKSELERWYGVSIRTQTGLKFSDTYSGKFENESLEEVLKGLSFIYRFNFRIEESNVLITDIEESKVNSL